LIKSLGDKMFIMVQVALTKRMIHQLM